MKYVIKTLSLLLSLILMLSGISFSAAAATPKMKIYCLNLTYESEINDDEEYEDGDKNYGDSVLLETNGEYLLMDTGSKHTASSVVNYLKQLGVEELSVYISHLHPDHTGGLKEINKNFTINKLYIPDYTCIATEYISSTGYNVVEYTDRLLKKSMKIKSGLEENSDKVVYLQKGCTFSVGAVSAEVLGPVGEHSPSDYAEETTDEIAQQKHYLNDYSLTTMFTCGKVKYLTTGDIEKREEAALLNTYSSDVLSANILKMPHHGLTTTSNTEEFFAAVKAKYFFAENMGYKTIVKDGINYYKNHTAIKRAQKHGIPYMVGTENASLIINVASNKVSLYKDANADMIADENELLSGWVQLHGIAQTSKGKDYTGDNFYYIDSNGKTLTGMQTLDGKTYYFGTGGAMHTGHYTKSGSTYFYNGFHTYGSNLRYYYEDGSIAYGFCYLKGDSGNTYLYYIKPNGYRFKGSSAWNIYEIDGKRYAINQNGVVYTNGNMGGFKSYKVSGKTQYRYFNSVGVMAEGWNSINGETYLFDIQTGYREHGLKKLGVNYYYFDKDGKFQKNKTLTQNGAKFVFDSYGILQNPKPKKPKKLKVTAKKKKKAVISWEKVKDSSGYIVYRATSKKGKYTAIKTINKSSTKNYTDKTVKSKKTYYYKVCAYKQLDSTKFKSSATTPKKLKTK